MGPNLPVYTRFQSTDRISYQFNMYVSTNFSFFSILKIGLQPTMNLLERALHTYTLSECIDPFDIRSVPIMTDLATNIKPGIFYKYLITYPYITYINILPRISSYHKILHITVKNLL